LPTEAEIAGTKASIKLTSRFYEPSAKILYYDFSIKEAVEIAVEKTEGWGYQYEAQHVNNCLQQGLTESPVMTHELTLTLMETLDSIRSIAGIKYPQDV
ncbi:hypothetical protein, partial [Hydrotalea sp.]|uniref:hypothetical protein n=1 Tax=Hydrotalea sp. TaxID=2881279 RepID=UPI003D11DAB1